jgi:hypothetical protein
MRKQSPAVLGYFTREERDILEAGDAIPTVKRRLDELVLRRVARTAFQDFFNAYEAAGKTPHSWGEIAGVERPIGDLTIPLSKLWNGSVEFGFDTEEGSKTWADVMAIRAIASPKLDTPNGERLDDEMWDNGVRSFHDFTRSPGDTGDIWTPYRQSDDPVAVADLIATLHQPLLNAARNS